MKSHTKAPDTHHRLYRFRFHTTEEQAEQLQRTFGACPVDLQRGAGAAFGGLGAVSAECGVPRRRAGR
ncbi:helix-turn-helix domain-containing protein [Streptomyces canus]|uniref:helix-turn-helix domain-containing protein n=1 Tax=Streptomyces canus TaxID=58343 RepID=UPI0034063347